MRLGGGHITRLGGEERYIQGFFGGELRERDHLQDPDVNGRIILRWNFRKYHELHGLD